MICCGGGELCCSFKYNASPPAWLDNNVSDNYSDILFELILFYFFLQFHCVYLFFSPEVYVCFSDPLLRLSIGKLLL